MEEEEGEDDQYALERIFLKDVYKEENETFDIVGSERALTSGDEAWVVPLLVVSGVSLTVVLVYQVVVVLRASRTSPSRRHLFLSQALLLGLLLGSSLGLVHSLEQTAPTCVAIRLGTGF